jgi:hypothetical protein
MTIPTAIHPILQELEGNPLFPRGMPLEFWTSPDHRKWIAAFTGFGSALRARGLPADGFPPGYALVALLFPWETQCQFDGWHALANGSDDLDRIFAAYAAVGMADEARALCRARKAWIDSGGDVEATSAAYRLEPNGHSCDLDRLESLAAYFIDHADRMFHLPR